MALPAATIAEGPLGLEGQHTWNGLTLNVPGSPRFKLDRITGRGIAEADDIRESRQAVRGEIAYQSQERGKTLTYEGRVMANSLPEMRTLENQLRGAFGDRNAMRTLTISPPGARGGVSWQAHGRALTCDIDDDQQRGENAVTTWQRGFVASLRLLDPRFRESTVQQVLGTASGIGMTVQNDGNAPGDPFVTIHGPLPAATYIDKITAGGAVIDRLRFDDLPVEAGQSVSVDFLWRTATVSTGVDGTLYLNDDQSDYWNEGVDGFGPSGQTFIRVTGGVYDVSWQHTSW